VLRKLTFAWLLTLACASTASAQNWAEKMFEVTNHDFGTVARGAKSDFSFKLKNIYKETLHISGVRSSCGCTTPTITKDTVPTLETSEIIASLNTKSFLGNKSATITVTFDQPFVAEVQLRVQGNIRGDVVFTPGVVQLGSVDQGTTSEQRVSVTYAGRADWSILDVQSTNAHFEVEMDEISRDGGRVAYNLLVRLKGDAPSGYLSDELVLVTNDSNAQRIPLAVEGRVVSDLTITPASLFLGEVAKGQSVTKKLVVRSSRPFRILGLDCDDASFNFEVSEEAKPIHVVAVTFVPDHTGKIEKEIRIKTDRESGGTTSLVAHAIVSE
jgi:hypothetical protein